MCLREDILKHSCHYHLDSRFTLKGTGAVYAPDKTFDTQHIKIDLKVDLNRHTLKGHCQTTLQAITGESNAMVFDAVNFNIEKVNWNGQRIPYQYRKGKLTLKTRKNVPEGEKVVVDIYYRVQKPKLGFYFLKPDRAYPKRPWQAWTQGEDEYARYWFPCHDAPGERASTEVLATVPKGFIAISNGQALKTVHNKKDKTTTYHWLQKIPHAPYLVTLTVGRFSLIKDKWKNLPVQYYCEKGREKEAKRAFGNTPDMLSFFSKSIGVSYPYAKYAQVAVSDFIYGGMENTSATTQTDTALLDKRASLDYTSDELVAHELAHQWFGDYLTCKDWSHAWLNESFATYFEALFKRHDRGNDEYLYAIYQNSEEYFHEDKERYRRPLVTNQFKNPTDLFDRHLYEKGSVILYMIHRLLGERLFWKSIRTYVDDNKGQPVETVDLINAIQKATGRNMRKFFDEWVYRAGHPTYTLRTWWDPRKKELHLRLVQSNASGGERGLHHMQTTLLVVTKKGEKRFPLEVKDKSHHFHFKVEAEPLMVVFDPDHLILKRIEHPRSEAALIYQLKNHTNPLGRIEAAQSLSKIQSEKALMALRDALIKEKFWGVQTEVAYALSSFRSEKAALILVHSLDVIENPKVRRAIYAALRGYKNEQVALEVGKRYKKEASYFAEANGLRALGSLSHPKAEEILKKALEEDSWNNVIRIAALDGLSSLKSQGLIPFFVKYTKWGQPHRVRMAAIRALASYGPGNDETQNRFIELAQDPYLLVQIAAVQALHRIGDERAVPILKKYTTGDLDGRLKRLSEEAVTKIQKGFQ